MKVANDVQQWRQWFSYDRWSNRAIDSTQDSGDPNPRTYGAGINNKAFEKEDSTNRIYAPGDLPLANSQRRMRYDNAGNLINDTYSGSGERVYDAENRIIKAWGGDSQWQFYSYNADGHRTRRKINNQETWQVYGFDAD